VEKTVEVVRNHEDGTCVTSGIVTPKHIAYGVWEWTPDRTSTEGRSLKNPVGGAQ